MRNHSSRLRFKIRLRSFDAEGRRTTLPGRPLGKAMPLGAGLQGLELAGLQFLDGGPQASLNIGRVLPQQVDERLLRDRHERCARASSAGDQDDLVPCGYPPKQAVGVGFELNRVDSRHGLF